MSEGGLGVGDVVGAEDVGREVFEEACDAEGEAEVLVAAVGDDGAGEFEGGEESLGAGDLAEFGAALLAHERADVVHEVERECDALVLLHPADDICEVGADERADALLWRHENPATGEELRDDGVHNEFGVDEGAVAVEEDGVEQGVDLGRRGVGRSGGGG